MNTSGFKFINSSDMPLFEPGDRIQCWDSRECIRRQMELMRYGIDTKELKDNVLEVVSVDEGRR